MSELQAALARRRKTLSEKASQSAARPPQSQQQDNHGGEDNSRQSAIQDIADKDNNSSRVLNDTSFRNIESSKVAFATERNRLNSPASKTINILTSQAMPDPIGSPYAPSDEEKVQNHSVKKWGAGNDYSETAKNRYKVVSIPPATASETSLTPERTDTSSNLTEWHLKARARRQKATETYQKHMHTLTPNRTSRSNPMHYSDDKQSMDHETLNPAISNLKTTLQPITQRINSSTSSISTAKGVNTKSSLTDLQHTLQAPKKFAAETTYEHSHTSYLGRNKSGSIAASSDGNQTIINETLNVNEPTTNPDSAIGSITNPQTLRKSTFFPRSTPLVRNTTNGSTVDTGAPMNSTDSFNQKIPRVEIIQSSGNNYQDSEKIISSNDTSTSISDKANTLPSTAVKPAGQEVRTDKALGSESSSRNSTGSLNFHRIGAHHRGTPAESRNFLDRKSLDSSYGKGNESISSQMTERYKAQQEQQKQPQHLEVKIQERSESKESGSAVPIYYRSGMRPVPSPTSKASGLNLWLQKSGNIVTGEQSKTCGSDWPSSSSIAPANIDESKAGAPSDVSVVDGSLFTTSSENHVPEFLRTKLKPVTPKRGITAVINRDENTESATMPTRTDSSTSHSSIDNDERKLLTVSGAVHKRWRPPIKTFTPGEKPVPIKLASQPEKEQRLLRPMTEKPVYSQHLNNNLRVNILPHQPVSNGSSDVLIANNGEIKEDTIIEVSPSTENIKFHLAATVPSEQIFDLNKSVISSLNDFQDEKHCLNDAESSNVHNSYAAKTIERYSDEVNDQNDAMNEQVAYFSNYDTAVLAAKEAIDSSNRNRIERQHKRNVLYPVENKNFVDDPGLKLEPSPESSENGQSVSGEPTDLDTFVKDMFNRTEPDSHVRTVDINTSEDMSGTPPEADGFRTEESSNLSKHELLKLNSIFRSSFLNDNNGDNTIPGDDVDTVSADDHFDFNFDRSSFFQADPFDPFESTVNDQNSIEGDSNNLSEKITHINKIDEFLEREEKNASFNAQFEEDFQCGANDNFTSKLLEDKIIDLEIEQTMLMTLDDGAQDSAIDLTKSCITESNKVLDVSIPNNRALDSVDNGGDFILNHSCFLDEAMRTTVDSQERSKQLKTSSVNDQNSIEDDSNNLLEKVTHITKIAEFLEREEKNASFNSKFEEDFQCGANDNFTSKLLEDKIIDLEIEKTMLMTLDDGVQDSAIDLTKPCIIESNKVLDVSLPSNRALDSVDNDGEFILNHSCFLDEAMRTTVDSQERSKQLKTSLSTKHHLQEKYIDAETDDVDLYQDNFASFYIRHADLDFGAIEDLHRIPSPTQNPLTRNLIICRCKDGGDFVIEEIDVTNNMMPATILSAHVISNELREKISQPDVKVAGISSIISLAAGTHRVHGRARVRVAVVAEILAASALQGLRRMRIVAVWKWGYNPGGKELASLQSVLTTESIDELNSGYDPKTLQVADGLLFLGGHTIWKGRPEPTVFMAKPAVRDGWVSVRISDTLYGTSYEKEESNKSSVSVLAALNDADTFLAVGLYDGSISVWTYDLAVRTNRISTQNIGIKVNEPSDQISSLLQPMCRMHGQVDVAHLIDRDCLWRSTESPSRDVMQPSILDSECTSLSWINPCSSGISALPLLAAAFTSGIAVYHVSLPLQSFAEPSSDTPSRSEECVSSKIHNSLTTNLTSRTDLHASKSFSSVSIVEPLAKAKFCLSQNTKYYAKLSWFDLGPGSPPCLSVLCSNSKISKIFLCVIDIPWYGSADVTNSNANKSYRSIGVLCQGIVNPSEGDVEIFDVSQIGSIGTYSAGDLLLSEPTLPLLSNNSKKINSYIADSYFSSLSRPVSSIPLGLTTDGNLYSMTCDKSVKSDYQDTILTVFSTITCSKVQSRCSVVDEKELSIISSPQKWSIPSQRTWLLITSPGDTNERDHLWNNSKEKPIISDNVEKTGAIADVVCELTCGENPFSGLTPQRIVREDGGRRAAVLFSSGYFGSNVSIAFDASRPRRRTHTRIAADSVAYAIFDIDEAMKNRGSTSFTLRYGCDVVFLPSSQMEGGFYCSSMVVLDPYGTGISITTVITSHFRKDGVSERVIESMEKCSLQHENIEGHRVFALLNNVKPQLLLAGHSKDDGRPCLIFTNHQLERDSFTSIYTLIEAESNGERLWLKNGEEIVTALELPQRNGTSRAQIAVATQGRVMIVSSDPSLSIIAEIEAHITCPSLIPLGSDCVAFSSSSTPYCGGTSRIMYLSCLGNTGGHGIISTVPCQRHGRAHTLLNAIRPDRLIYSVCHSAVRFVNNGDEENKFVVPIPFTHPIFLLEPLISNALCQDGARGADAAKSFNVQQSLRTVIERFGRKDSSFPHGEHQGIGSSGTGITNQVYHMLIKYDCKDAAFFLLTGITKRNFISQPKILPPWISITSKLLASTNTDISMQVLANGNNDLSEFLLHPDHGEQNVLLKPNDASSLHAELMAYDSLGSEPLSNVFRLLDFSGKQSSEDVLRQIVLSDDAKTFLNDNQLINGMFNSMNDSSPVKDTIKNHHDLLLGVMAKFSCDGKSTTRNIESILSQLSPSVQCPSFDRARPRIVSKSFIKAATLDEQCGQSYCNTWSQSINENKQVWRSGPFGMKEKLLALDTFEDWLGTCCPTILGEEGVAIAIDTGEQTLANILSKAADTTPDESINLDRQIDSLRNRANPWIDGVGEGHLDEDNLSLYIRFSEGADEDNKWKVDGFDDLSKYRHKAFLYGSEFATLEATTSSADEGEEGKVQLLYDIVYKEGAPRYQATGIFIEVLRGDSLDIGMLHNSQQKSRQKCTIELWYHLPQAQLMADEIILVRRSIINEAIAETSNLCLPDEKHNTLWELAVLPTGLLEFRTGAGSVVTSAMVVETDEDNPMNAIVSWEREDGGGGWNHVCILLSSQLKSCLSEVTVSILMNGLTVISCASLILNPLGAEPIQDLNEDDMDNAMEKSMLIFGIGPSVGFRMTDIRVWACLRDEDDVKMMMYEHLTEAVLKRKIKVNIQKDLQRASGGILAHPIPLPQADRRRSGPKSLPRLSQLNKPFYKNSESMNNSSFTPSFANFEENENAEKRNIPDISDEKVETLHSNDGSNIPQDRIDAISTTINETVETIAPGVNPNSSSLAVTLSELISTKVTGSVSSAIIRGPPATRHFGGNRGGLTSDRNRHGSKYNGVSSVVICGPEKSIVFSNDMDPPAKTYPIGASGAVLSDIMDDNHSHYLCCFLAKERRIVVFELTRKSVVVELQMKTKLNFWRYLPLEVNGGKLTFMLITPVGGFHWNPLDDSPRPCPVWKRPIELVSKKILTYEEGGSNGKFGPDIRSTVALVLASIESSDTAVEAYCIQMNSESNPLCISSDVLGAALYKAPVVSEPQGPSLPHVVSIQKDDTSRIHIIVQSLQVIDPAGEKTLALGEHVDSALLDAGHEVLMEGYDGPSMSMGTSPEALCCCIDDIIVAIIRKSGQAFVYDFSDGKLILIGQTRLDQYVVDAAIRLGNNEGMIELVLLLCERDDHKEGRVATISILKPG